MGLGLIDLGEDANASDASPVVVVDAGAGSDAGDGVAGADSEFVECGGRLEGLGVVRSSGVACGDMTAKIEDDARGLSDGEEGDEQSEGRRGGAEQRGGVRTRGPQGGEEGRTTTRKPTVR